MIDVISGDAFQTIDGVIEGIRGTGRSPVLVTDPPFNVGYHYKSYDDRLPEREYWRSLADMVRKFDGACVVHYPEALDRLSIELGEAPVRRLSWVYPSNTARQHRDVAFYGVKPDFRNVRQPYRNMSDKRVKALYERTGGARSYDWVEVNQVKNVSREKTAHPCQMPLKVMNLVIGVLPDGIVVVDPFCGSGTTLVACRDRGVDAVGIELDEDYASIARARVLEAETGRHQ